MIHDDRPGGSRPAIRLVDTDFVLAREVGAILHAAGRGSVPATRLQLMRL